MSTFFSLNSSDLCFSFSNVVKTISDTADRNSDSSLRSVQPTVNLHCPKIQCTLYLNPFPNKPWFLRVCRVCLLKTLWEKEKLLVMSNFSFSHSVFYPFRERSAIFNKFEIVVCKLKFVVWGRVKSIQIN